MRHEAETRNLFIENAIRLIAEGGFELATTKRLAYSGGELPDFKMNEVYIYRLFGNKEALFDAAFMRLDTEIHHVLCDSIRVMRESEGSLEDRLYAFFSDVWRFILDHEERCRCYVRFYYSIYFKGALIEAHNSLLSHLEDELGELFKEEANVHAILHSIYIGMFGFAVRAHNGEIEKDEENGRHVFNVLYSMAKTYLK